MIHQCVDLHSAGRATAFIYAVLGCAVFWGIFGWPLAALYQEFSIAARALWQGTEIATGLFPHDTGSTLFTALFLAVLPTFLLLLVVLSGLIRRSVVAACLGELRTRHEQLCTEMIAGNRVSLRVSEPRLDACLSLFLGE